MPPVSSRSDGRVPHSGPRERVVAVVWSFGSWPGGVVRLGVVLVVAVAFVASAFAFVDALDGADFWADRNTSLTYVARSVPFEEAVGSQKVAEDARLWMPEDATYRIFAASDLQGPRQWAAPDFLTSFLLPRRQSESLETPWVICINCTIAKLGPDFEVLSEGNGVLFGRISP